MMNISGIRLETALRCAALAVCTLLCVACSPHIEDTLPGAELEHNVRLVYWDRDHKAQTADPYVWRLNVPEALLRRQTDGTSPDKHVRDPWKKYDRANPIVGITGRIDPESGAILPMDRELGRREGQYVFHANIGPRSSRYSALEKTCTILSPKRVVDDPAYFLPDGCSFYAGGCDYSYEIDGWSFSLSVSRRLPLPAYAYCDPIRDWLDAQTVHRDPIPVGERPTWRHTDWKRYIGHPVDGPPPPNPNAGPPRWSQYPLDVMYPEIPDYDAIQAELEQVTGIKKEDDE